jgi:hypothetical protein
MDKKERRENSKKKTEINATFNSKMTAERRATKFAPRNKKNENVGYHRSCQVCKRFAIGIACQAGFEL